MISRDIIKPAVLFNNGEMMHTKTIKTVAVPTTKFERRIIDFKYASINGAGGIDEQLMRQALPKGKQQRRFFLKFADKMPELLSAGSSDLTDLDFIASAMAMKKDPVRMAKWLKRHGVSTSSMMTDTLNIHTLSSIN